VVRRFRWYALAVALLVLIGTGVFVGTRVLGAHHPAASPQARTSAHPSPSVSPSPSPLPGAGITGPLNILIVGVDTREKLADWIPHSDAVMILHIDRGLTRGYLVSLPRDLVVTIPAFAPSHFGGARTKLTHAMAYGSEVPGSNRPNTAQGFQLLARTVSAYTHIPRFDAGALLTFTGLRRLVDMMGGVNLYVDERTASIHMAPNGKSRPVCGGCAHGYGGPQATYTVGVHHLAGWQALDYARQRYIPGSDYARQRHQRQLIKAIVATAFNQNLLTNPGRVLNMINALAKTLIYTGAGHTAIDYIFALRHMRAEAITLVGLPGVGVYSHGTYLGEALNGIQSSYFAALRGDRLASFVAAHPNLVNRTPLA
jgi:polyisoprenyl-teichoic acid--peptidoglycan teichoic acid transferase